MIIKNSKNVVTSVEMVVYNNYSKEKHLVMLNETEEPVEVCGMTYPAGRTLLATSKADFDESYSIECDRQISDAETEVENTGEVELYGEKYHLFTE